MTTSMPVDQVSGAVAAADNGDVVTRRHATVSAADVTNSSGTATRSARATARGPAHTIAVAAIPSATAQTLCDPPAIRAHAEAAMTLFSAIHAKLDTYRRTATSPAPRTPSAARVAMSDGTRSREPSGASAATSAAPAMLPIPMIAN